MTVQDAVRTLGAGRMVVVTDDADRENEADLVVAASLVTPDQINFMITHGRGLVCVPMEARRLEALALPPMVSAGTDPFGTKFAVSVDLQVPGSTGISAADRAATVRALADPSTRGHHLRRPGHVFPLAYTEGGVLVRRGHTEASVDLARLAGLPAAAAICEILAADGTMLRGAAVHSFARAHSLPVISIDEIAEHRRATETMHLVQREAAPVVGVRRVVETRLPTTTGVWRALGYADDRTGAEHVAMVLGDPRQVPAPLVRIHSECRTGDSLFSRRCDCGDQLETAMRLIAQSGAGVLIHVGGHEGRGIGLLNKLRAYALQDEGLDTVDANTELGFPVDDRSYSQSAEILLDLDLPVVRLLTNNPRKVDGLVRNGVSVVAMDPLLTRIHPGNAAYLRTKQERCGHLLPV